MREVRGFCTLCRSQCGTITVVDAGKVISVRADPSHPTGAAVCLKGKSAPEAIAADNRLLFPMRRTRPKSSADPGWVRISWDEALQETASRLAQIRDTSGPQAVAFAVTTKSGTAIADSVEWVDRFVRVFGSPNVAGAVDICNWHKDNAHKFTFGVGTPSADYAHAELILVWGHNPTSTWLAQSEAIARGRGRGAALIVVDPRATPLARAADVWLQVRPGTDAALALGLARLVIEQHGYDDAFVRRWTNAPFLLDRDSGELLRTSDLWADVKSDFVVWDQEANRPVGYDTAHAMPDALATACALMRRVQVQDLAGRLRDCETVFSSYWDACAPWTPEAVEATTGVESSHLRAAAALIAERRKIAYHAWNGVGQNPNATQIERSIATLYALRGCFDDVGGNRIYAKQPINRVDGLNLISKAQLSKAIGAAERPLGPPAEGRVKAIDVYRAMLTGEPYKIRALVGFGTNHLMTQTDVEEIRRGLESCEFHVHCDIVDTPTSRYADILLPICTPWERESLRVGFEISEEAENHIQLRPAMVAPRGESRSDLQVVFDLACRLGMEEEFFGGSIEAGWNHMLAPLAMTVAQLRRSDGGVSRPLMHAVRKYASSGVDGSVTGFATPTRRVEFYSERLLHAGYPPLPQHQNYETNDPRFPLLVTSMKNGYFCHSEHRAVPSLRKRSPFPQLFLHPALASERRIADGAWVKVRSRDGHASFKAKFDDRLRVDVMAADFGFWESNDALGLSESGTSGDGTTNFNALVGAALRDPISGSTNHKAVECDIALDPWFGPTRWSGFRALEVTEVHRETPTALRIVVRSTSGPLPDYLPGQYIKLRSSSQDEAPTVRAYSLTSPAWVEQRMTYEVCVGLDAVAPEYPGRMSGHLHRVLKVGDYLEAQAPAGIFMIPVKSSRPVILIATGIGITPFISYLETLASTQPSHPVLLLYGNRSGEQHAFKTRLRDLRTRLAQLRVIDFYSRPRPQDQLKSDYDIAGRIKLDVVDQALVEAGARAYICGSPAAVQTIKAGLKARGVPGHDIFSELFVSESLPQIDTHATATVEFLRSNKTVQWHPSDGTLLNLAEKHGITAASGCRVGQCESCVVSVVAGKVHFLHGAAADEPGTVLTCQAIPDGPVSLDL